MSFLNNKKKKEKGKKKNSIWFGLLFLLSLLIKHDG